MPRTRTEVLPGLLDVLDLAGEGRTMAVRCTVRENCADWKISISYPKRKSFRVGGLLFRPCSKRPAIWTSQR